MDKTEICYKLGTKSLYFFICPQCVELDQKDNFALPTMLMETIIENMHDLFLRALPKPTNLLLGDPIPVIQEKP